MSRLIRTGSKIGIVIATLMGLAFGGAFVAAGLWARSATQPLEDGVIVTAEVVDVDVRTDSDGDRTYAPVVDYVDPATGQTHRITGSVATSSRPGIGSTEEVSLRPGEPSSARVVGPVWFPWIFIGVGGVAMLVALFAAAKALTSSALTGQPHDGRATGADSVQTEHVSRGGPMGRTEGDHNWTMVDEPAGPAQPGFHPDPDDEDRLRYWDGTRWTDNYAPVVFDS